MKHSSTFSHSQFIIHHSKIWHKKNSNQLSVPWLLWWYFEPAAWDAQHIRLTSHWIPWKWCTKEMVGYTSENKHGTLWNRRSPNLEMIMFRFHTGILFPRGCNFKKETSFVSYGIETENSPKLRGLVVWEFYPLITLYTHILQLMYILHFICSRPPALNELPPLVWSVTASSVILANTNSTVRNSAQETWIKLLCAFLDAPAIFWQLLSASNKQTPERFSNSFRGNPPC